MTEVVQSTEPEVQSEDQSVFSVMGQPSDDAQTAEPETSEPALPSPEELFGDGNIDWDTVDYTKLDINKLPKEYQPLARQAKKMQASFTRAQQAVREKERLLDSNLTQMQQLQRMAPQTQQGQPAVPPSEVQQLQSFLSEYGFTPEVAGYQEYALVAKMIQDARKQDQGQISQLVQVVQQLYNAQQQVTGHIQQTQVQPYNEQFQAALDAGHDADDIRQYAGVLTTMVDQVVNPATGKPHTIQSAYELVSGRAAARSAEMQGQAASAKRNARTRTSIPTNGAASASNGSMTDAELKSELRKLGFT